jgi:hypothetical protein
VRALSVVRQPLWEVTMEQLRTGSGKPRYASVKATALHNGTSRSKIYVLIRKKCIRAVRFGGRTLVDCASADRYFDTLPQWEPRS